MEQTVEQKSIKIMLNALQNQRNSANDRAVDLEVAKELIQERAKALELELSTAYEANVNLRQSLTTATNERDDLLEFATHLSTLAPESFGVVETDGKFSLIVFGENQEAKSDTLLETQETPMFIEPTIVPVVESSGFEDSSITPPKKEVSGTKPFYKRGK